MAGMEVVVVECDEKGNINVEDLKKKAEEHKAEPCLFYDYLSFNTWSF